MSKVNFFYLGNDGRRYLDYDAFINQFFSRYPVIRHEKTYYMYDSKKGIWTPENLEDIEIKAAKYFKRAAKQRWSVGYKSQTIETLKVNTNEAGEMDSPSTKICLKNGVLDMQDGSFHRGYCKEYYFTNRLEVNYNKRAKAPLFEQFLKDVSCNNLRRRRTLEEFMGLALTKEIGCGKAMILRGTGRNGKSVYLNTLCGLLGKDRYTTISLRELPNFGASALPGKTLAVMSETSRDASGNLMTTELKQLITGENMFCNAKYREAKTIKPYAKVLILTNHSIGVSGDESDGALRRLFVLPFEYYVPDGAVDLNLEKKLKKEMSGILNIAVKGYQRLASRDFVYSSQKESDKLVSELLKTENPLRSFIKERIVFKHGSNLSYAEFRQHFLKWCRVNGLDIPVGTDSKQIYAETAKCYNIERFKSDKIRGMKNIEIRQ